MNVNPKKEEITQIQLQFAPETNAKIQPEVHESSIDIIFKNISYSVQVEKKVDRPQIPCLKQMEEKPILHNVTGIFKAGEISAIMGASGAGKTTLLNLLACRIKNTSGGTLHTNKDTYSGDNFGDFANYVMQTDVLMQTLTVKQTLQFAGNLKIDASPQQKRQRIEDLCNKLKLQKCLDTLVGGILVKGISGGERKRTSIAFQLISDPQVIMLDEPTSGLDSLTSYIIVKYLSQLAHQHNKTVFMTIHQPSNDIFALFDRLLLLVEGRVIYQGHAGQAEKYFADNFKLECPNFMNPPDYFMSIMHHDALANRNRYPQYYEKYQEKIAKFIEHQIQNSHTDKVVHREIKVSVCSAFSSLLKRDLLNAIRNPMIIRARLFQTIFMGIFIGGLFFNAGKQDYTIFQKFMNVEGFFFEYCIANLMTSLAPVSLVFPMQKQIFLKEEGAKLYGTLPYFISRNIIQLPYLLLIPLIFCIVLYWMVGLSSTASQFFIFYLVAFLVSLAGNSLGLLLGSLVHDAKSVSAITPLFLLPFILFSGFFKNRANLPVWIGWIEFISPIKYGFNAFSLNQTSNKPSMVAFLNFDLTMWSAIGILIALSLTARFASLFFLWILRSKLQ